MESFLSPARTPYTTKKIPMSLHLHLRSLVPGLLLVVLAVLLEPASPTLALAQTTDGGDGSGCVLGPLCGLGDPGTWLQQTIEAIVRYFLSGLATDLGDAIVGFINDVNFLTRTPENLSYNDTVVQEFAAATRLLANGLLAVVVLVGGFNVMMGPYIRFPYHHVLELLPRLVLGGILINTATWWCRLAIDANNAICDVFGGHGLAGVVAGIQRVAGVPIAGVVMLLIAVVMTIALAAQQLMRLALVDVLIVLAPLAALLWILPQTQAWGGLWGRLFVGTVFAQAVQVLTLRLGFNLATGLSPITAPGIVEPLLGIAILALALKIPRMMGGGAAGGNVVSGILGTAAGAAVGTTVGVGVRAALGVGARVVPRGGR
jgi:hypothetical protein